MKLLLNAMKLVSAFKRGAVHKCSYYKRNSITVIYFLKMQFCQLSKLKICEQKLIFYHFIIKITFKKKDDKTFEQDENGNFIPNKTWFDSFDV